MKKDWSYITKIAGNKPVTIAKVKTDDNITVEGEFELPPLAQLTFDEQVFVAVFIKSHGSIKEMEKHFGISYPTVKNRLNQIGNKLDFVNVESAVINDTILNNSLMKDSILERLERGEISVASAVALLEKGESDE